MSVLVCRSVCNDVTQKPQNMKGWNIQGYTLKVDILETIRIRAIFRIVTTLKFVFERIIKHNTTPIYTRIAHTLLMFEISNGTPYFLFAEYSS